MPTGNPLFDDQIPPVAARVAGNPVEAVEIIGTGVTVTIDPVVRRIALAVAGGGGGEAQDNDLDTIAAIDSTVAGALVTDGSGWIRKTYAALKTALGLTKADVGLGSVDNVADASKTLTGDVGGTLGATVIGAAKVTRAMEVNQAANSLRGNNTGSPATAIDLTAAQVKTLLAIAQSDVSGLVAALALLAPLASPTFTGTVVFPAGTVTLAEQANLAANSIIGNNTGSPGVPLALTAAQVKTLLAIAQSDVAGLVAALALLAPLASPTFTGTPVFPAAVITLANQVNAAANSFRGNNTGSPATPLDMTVAQAKTLLALAVADVSGAAPTANATFTGTHVVPAATITKANIVNAAANSFTGNNTGSAATVIDMTVAQAKTLLALAVADVSGAAPLAAPSFTGTVVSAGSIAGAGSIKSSHATLGIGYNTGAGGTVTQITSRVTGVTLNKASGTITLFSATLAADTDVSFVLTNSAIAVGDILIFNVVGGAAVKGGYSVNAIAAAGSATVTVHNVTPTITATEAPVIAFAVIKAVTA